MIVDILRYADWLPTLEAVGLPMNKRGNVDYYLEHDELIEADIKRLVRLVKAGPDHSKSIRGAWVTFKIEAPRYWWSEMDTYCIGKQPLSSTSTMHKITSRDLIEDDFEKRAISGEQLDLLNNIRNSIHVGKTDKLILMKQHLPESFLQTRVVQMNYQSIRNLYYQRCIIAHRLPEWKVLGSSIESLPYFEEFINMK